MLDYHRQTVDCRVVIDDVLCVVVIVLILDAMFGVNRTVISLTSYHISHSVWSPCTLYAAPVRFPGALFFQYNKSIWIFKKYLVRMLLKILFDENGRVMRESEKKT